jgi:predicted amidohydrolase YtcJ
LSKGTLEPGMVADLQIYSRDPLTEPTATWDQFLPNVVLVGGAAVHGRL